MPLSGSFKIVLAAVLIVLCLSCAARADTDGNTFQLAMQLVKAQMGEEARTKAGDALTLMLTPLVLRDNPGQDEQVSHLMQQNFQPVIASGMDDVARQTAELYAQSFSADELKQMIDFQESPVGKKLKKFNVESTPKIRDISKTTMSAKTAEATKALVTALKADNLHVPRELDH